MKNPIGSILGFALIGYLVAAAYRSYKNGFLTFPFFTHNNIAPPPASNLSPDLMAGKVHQLLVENHGVKALLRPDTMPLRDIVYGQLLAVPDKYLVSVYEAYGKLYAREGKGSLTRVIDDAHGDPFDLDKTKTALVIKLRNLNCK